MIYFYYILCFCYEQHVKFISLIPKILKTKNIRAFEYIAKLTIQKDIVDPAYGTNEITFIDNNGSLYFKPYSLTNIIYAKTLLSYANWKYKIKSYKKSKKKLKKIKENENCERDEFIKIMEKIDMNKPCNIILEQKNQIICDEINKLFKKGEIYQFPYYNIICEKRPKIDCVNVIYLGTVINNGNVHLKCLYEENICLIFCPDLFTAKNYYNISLNTDKNKKELTSDT